MYMFFIDKEKYFILDQTFLENNPIVDSPVNFKYRNVKRTKS